MRSIFIVSPLNLNQAGTSSTPWRIRSRSRWFEQALEIAFAEAAVAVAVAVAVAIMDFARARYLASK